MEEETKPTETKEESTVDRAERVAQELNKALQRVEELKSREILAGNSGATKEEKPKEETAHEHRLRMEREAGIR